MSFLIFSCFDQVLVASSFSAGGGAGGASHTFPDVYVRLLTVSSGPLAYLDTVEDHSYW